MMDYLDVQFRLYREDFISTLRDGVKSIGLKGRSSNFSSNFKVFENFHFIGTLCKDGVKHVLQ